MLWLVAFIGFSLFYIALPGLIPTGWRWLFKIIPIALLLFLTLTRTAGKVRTLLGLGLVLSAIGDVLLAMDGLFVQGLAAFLLAQVTYTVLFVTQRRWQPRRRAFAQWRPARPAHPAAALPKLVYRRLSSRGAGRSDIAAGCSSPWRQIPGWLQKPLEAPEWCPLAWGVPAPARRGSGRF